MSQNLQGKFRDIMNFLILLITGVFKEARPQTAFVLKEKSLKVAARGLGCQGSLVYPDYNLP